MKFSLKLPDNQDHKNPIVKGKLPITMFSQPFTSSFTSAINSSSDLSFSLSTNFLAGPCLKLTYSPMAASPSTAAAASGPFTLCLKSGLGLFGSPEDSPLVFSSQFSLSLAKPVVPSFTLLLKPRFGNFCLRKSAVSSPNDQLGFRPSDGARLDSGSDSNPKFGSVFAVDESMGWQELKLESGGGGRGAQEEFGVCSNGGVLQRHLDETKRIRDGVFSGVAVMARTVIPVTKRVAVNFRWGMNFAANPVTKMPFLTVNKISVERVEEVKEEKKKTGEEGVDVEFLKGMLFWMKKDVETLEKENRAMKQLLEEIKLGSMGNGAATSSGSNYGELESWRSNRSGWEESKSKNTRNGGQENDWRKKKSSEEENEGKNNRRGGEKNGSKPKGHSSTNRVNEVESELERAIKAASQVKA